MPITAPYVFTAGDDATSTRLNTRSSAIAELQSPPRARASQGIIQPINNATATAVLLDTEQTDTEGIHSTAVNTSRMTIVTPGRYWVNGQVTFNSSGTGYRELILRENGAAQRARHACPPASGIITSLQVCEEILFVAGDYIELVVTHTAGAALSLNTGSGATFLHVAWRGLV